MERADFYSLPRIYDVLHTPGTADEVDGLEMIAAKFGTRVKGRRGVWLEPACGTGRYLRVLAGRGYRAIGFDTSEEMVAYARGRGGGGEAATGSEDSVGHGHGRAGHGHGGAGHEHGRTGRGRTPTSSEDSAGRWHGERGRGHAEVFIADMAGFDRKLRGIKVDFAFNLINTIRHLSSDRAMLEHFASMARVMRPGAVYAVGISLSAYGREQEDEDVWRARRGGTRVTQVVQYLPPTIRRGPRARAERVVSHLTIQAGKHTRDVSSVYTLRTYDLAQWMGLIGKSALEVRAVVDEYGREVKPVEPGYAVYVLGRKR